MLIQTLDYLCVSAHSLLSMGVIRQARKQLGTWGVYSVSWLAQANTHSTRAPADSA